VIFARSLSNIRPLMPALKAPNDIRQELLAAMREIIRYAVMTLNAVRDPDAHYRGWAKLPTTIVRDIADAYGYSTPWVRRFSPTPRDVQQMEAVMPWLAWLRREEGQVAIRRIIAWSLGVSLWRIGQREECSDQTILNRIDRSVARIIKNFTNADIPIEYIEEPYQGVVYAMIFEKPPGPVTGEITLMRIYVGGKGIWKAGRYLRDGTHKIERLKQNP
jgi:Domain of unknown function (DUF6362)